MSKPFIERFPKLGAIFQKLAGNKPAEIKANENGELLLTEEQIQGHEAELNDLQEQLTTAQKDLQVATQKVTDKQASLDNAGKALKAALEGAELEATEDLTAGINALGAEITRLGKQPGATPTNPEKKADTQPDAGDKPDFYTPIDAEVEEYLSKIEPSK